MWDAGYEPYQKNGSLVQAVVEGSKPLKEFMLKNTREQDMAYFLVEKHLQAQKK